MDPISSLSSTVFPAVRALGAGATPAVPAFEADLARLAASVSPTPPGPAAPSFDNLLTRFVADVNAKQVAASQTVNGLLSGQGVPLHQAMLAMEEASVSFQLMVEVRNKLLESYQELMRMQI
jgi:flagellar hook-basal body complex protein FliE